MAKTKNSSSRKPRILTHKASRLLPGLEGRKFEVCSDYYVKRMTEFRTQLQRLFGLSDAGVVELVDKIEHAVLLHAFIAGDDDLIRGLSRSAISQVLAGLGVEERIQWLERCEVPENRWPMGLIEHRDAAAAYMRLVQTNPDANGGPERMALMRRLHEALNLVKQGQVPTQAVS
jgi:hypothetical protein